MNVSAIFIVAFFLLCQPSQAFAEKYLFVTFHYPPLEYAEKDLRGAGGVVEIVREVMSRLDHQVSIKVFPWTRALKMVRTGKADAIFTAYKNPERELFLYYSQEILFPQSVYFYKRKGDDSTFDGNLSTLQEKKIGVVSTISYGQIFEKHKQNLRLDRAANLEQSFGKLLKMRIDLVPSDINVAEYTLEKLGVSDEIVRIPTKLESVPSFIAFSRKRKLSMLRDEFDRELKKMKRSGEYFTLLEKYSIHR